MASQPLLEPALGVVIPTHNRPASLDVAVQSVLDQEEADVRVVVVDEGSEPAVDTSSGPMADPRVSVIRNEKPRGPAAARNLGVEQLDTPIIAFLDDDDWWQPAKARRCLDAFEQHPEVGVVTHRARFEYERGGMPPTGEVRIVEDPVGAWLRSQPPHVDCVAVRREVHERVRFDESFPAAADLDYMIRLAQDGPVAMIDEILAVHGSPTQRTTAINLDNRILGRLRFREKHGALFGEPGIEAFHLVRLGHLHRHNGERRRAIVAFARSLRARPSALALRGLGMATLPNRLVDAATRSRVRGRRGVHDVLITNVYDDDNRGGAAITAATVRAIRDAFPAASIGLVTVLDDATAFARSHRHTDRDVAADILPAAIPVGSGALGPALAVLRSLVHLATGRRVVMGTPTLRRLAAADAVVAKGGQLFRSFSWRGLPGLWLSGYPLVFARRCGVPACAYAISIGPFQPDRAGRASRRLTGLLLRCCRGVLVRERASYELALQLGVPRDRVHEVPDAVFATAPPPVDLTASVLRRLGLDGVRFVAITAAGHMSNPSLAAVIDPELAVLIRGLLDHGVVDRAAVVLQTDGEHTSDRVASNRFLDRLADDRAVLVDEDLGVAELMALYRGARLTVGGRVHSNIFSVVVGTPTFPFEYYGTKAHSLFETIGLGDLVIHLEQGRGAAQALRIADLLDDEHHLRERIRTVGEGLRIEAARSVDLLRRIAEEP